MDLRKAAEADPAYPRVVYIHLGSAADGQAFFDQFDPTAIAVADPRSLLYEGFGLGRARLTQLFGPEVIACGLRARRKGHGLGKPVGDPWTMPGVFLVRGDQVLWKHEARHIGDHPDFAEIGQIAP